MTRGLWAVAGMLLGGLSEASAQTYQVRTRLTGNGAEGVVIAMPGEVINIRLGALVENVEGFPGHLGLWYVMGNVNGVGDLSGFDSATRQFLNEFDDATTGLGWVPADRKSVRNIRAERFRRTQPWTPVGVGEFIDVWRINFVVPAEPVPGVLDLTFVGQGALAGGQVWFNNQWQIFGPDPVNAATSVLRIVSVGDVAKVGACCLPEGDCAVIEESECIDAGGVYLGDGSVCEAELCIGDCPADWDGNGLVNAADVGAFLTAYMFDVVNGTTETDVDGNGVVNAADVGAFLNVYFSTLGDC